MKDLDTIYFDGAYRKDFIKINSPSVVKILVVSGLSDDGGAEPWHFIKQVQKCQVSQVASELFGDSLILFFFLEKK